MHKLPTSPEIRASTTLGNSTCQIEPSTRYLHVQFNESLNSFVSRLLNQDWDWDSATNVAGSKYCLSKIVKHVASLIIFTSYARNVASSANASMARVHAGATREQHVQQAVRVATQYASAPCKLSSHLFARWNLFRHVSYLRHQQVDLWPFDLESGVLVTCDVDYLCASFILPRPLCSRVRSDVRDSQTDRRQTKASLDASALWGWRHNHSVVEICPLVIAERQCGISWRRRSETDAASWHPCGIWKRVFRLSQDNVHHVVPKTQYSTAAARDVRFYLTHAAAA